MVVKNSHSWGELIYRILERMILSSIDQIIEYKISSGDHLRSCGFRVDFLKSFKLVKMA